MFGERTEDRVARNEQSESRGEISECVECPMGVVVGGEKEKKGAVCTISQEINHLAVTVLFECRKD